MKMLIPTLLILLHSTAFAATPEEARIVDEMNLARTAPAKYLRILQNYRKLYHGKQVSVAPGVLLLTREGVRAADEAIAFLRRQKPLPPLTFSEGLAAASADLVRDEGPKGTLGHTDPAVGGMEERIGRHGAWTGTIGENLAYGSADPRTVVLRLIIDDGVPGRGHRKNIFNRSFRQAGVSCGPHATMETMCAMDFASDFREKKSEAH